MTGRDRTEGPMFVVLVAIVAVVALAAGSASFTHVHDWTMQHAPDGTPGWFGWANAVISELLPIAAFLAWQLLRRYGRPGRLAIAGMVAGAGLSLAAQVAVAERSASSWLLSALPALAWIFLTLLVKAVLAAQSQWRAARAHVDQVDADRAERDRAERVELARRVAELAARAERAEQAHAEAADLLDRVEAEREELAGLVQREQAARVDLVQRAEQVERDAAAARARAERAERVAAAARARQVRPAGRRDVKASAGGTRAERAEQRAAAYNAWLSARATGVELDNAALVEAAGGDVPDGTLRRWRSEFLAAEQAGVIEGSAR